MKSMRPLLRALPRQTTPRSTFASRRLLTTPSAPAQASVSEVSVNRQVKEDPGDGDEIFTEDGPSGKGKLLIPKFRPMADEQKCLDSRSPKSPLKPA
jgi:hypothetical protein